MNDMKKKLDEELSFITLDINEANDKISAITAQPIMTSHHLPALKIAGIAAAISVITVGSIFAANRYSNPYPNMGSTSGLINSSDNSLVHNINEYAKDIIPSNIEVTWDNYIATSNQLYATVTLKSKDNTPVIKISDTSIPTKLDFEYYTVTVNGVTAKMSNYHLATKDDSHVIPPGYCNSKLINLADDLTYATFEFQYTPYNHSLTDTTISFGLENLYSDYYNFERINPTKSLDMYSIGDVLSEDYKDISIKAIGTSESDTIFTITSSSNRDLSNIRILDVSNGDIYSHNFNYKALDNGDYQLTIKTTNNDTVDLSRYIFIKKMDETADVASTFNSTITFTPETYAKTLETAIDITSEPMHFDKLVANGLEINIYGTGDSDNPGGNALRTSNMLITLKSGEVIEATFVVAGGRDNGTNQYITYKCDCMIDVDNIQSIFYFGQTLYQAE